MNNKELDILNYLVRLQNGEKNVIEHIESEGQNTTITNFLLAKEMIPSKEEWEKLGFIFTEIPEDNILINAILPNGWKIKATEHSMWNDIIDENDKIRGKMFYKASFYDRRAHMNLEQRYKVSSEYIDDDSTNEIIYFGAPKEKLFIAGQINWPKDINELNEEEYFNILTKREELIILAEEFGNQNYPDWQSVHAYWENNKEATKKLTKTK